MHIYGRHELAALGPLVTYHGDGVRLVTGTLKGLRHVKAHVAQQFCLLHLLCYDYGDRETTVCPSKYLGRRTTRRRST